MKRQERTQATDYGGGKEIRLKVFLNWLTQSKQQLNKTDDLALFSLDRESD